MKKAILHILAGVAILGALGTWVGASYLDSLRVAADRAAQDEANRTWSSAATATRRLEQKGRDALDKLAAGGAFETSVGALLANGVAGRGFSLRVLGVVELGAVGADLAPAASRSLPPLPEQDQAALRRDAEAAFRAAAGWSRGADLALAQGQRGFWMFWSDRARGRVLAALASGRAGAFDLKVLAARTDAESDAQTAPIVANFGGDALALRTDRQFTLTDAGHAALSPNSLFAALALTAILLMFARRETSGVAAARAAERRAADRRHAELEEKLKHLAESTNVIPWSADLDRNCFTYVGSQIETMSGYSAANWKATGFWLQHIHPDDRRDVLSEINRDAGDDKFKTLEYRIRAADRGTLHIRNMVEITERRENGPRGRVVREAHGFMLDVTELHHQQQKLIEAQRAADEANTVKSEFLANMSHELRTPLNVVIGFSEIMKDQVFGPIDGGYRDYAAHIHTAGTHLLNLINELLDLSKIEAGRIDLIPEPTDLGAMLQECRDMLEDRMNAAGVRCRAEIDGGAPHVLVDERRIKQVILNLMSNAIKFTQVGGEISLTLKRAPGRRVTVEVRDTGIGMAPKDIPKALSKFSQIDSDLARKHDGTGLGLPIAKSLIELHGGVFELSSQLGVGTVARFHLPEEGLAVAA